MERAKELAIGMISCVSKSTVTGWIVASGQHFKDWSAAYKLFQGDRLNTDELFSSVLKQTLLSVDQQEENIYAHLDDTLLRKTGKKVSGAKWLRDPLGPPFQTNLIWGQRFVQTSVSVFQKMGPVACKTVPVDLVHCPAPVKPKASDSESNWQHYRESQKIMKLSAVGAKRIDTLRTKMNELGYSEKKLVTSVDGSYTNETVLKALPDNVTLIGRIRKDCKLNALPEEKASATGRRRIYGEALPTPEQIRQSDLYPWQTVEAYYSGAKRSFDVKIIPRVRWRKSGEMNLKLIIVRPTRYRLNQKSRLLYRDPVYLICTDPEMPIEKLLQAYLWRWGIEVNFKEQKTMLGCGQAQVRTEKPCEKVPAFHTAVYSLLLLAAQKTKEKQLPRPKWYRKKEETNITTGDVINAFRANNWAQNLNISYSDFVNLQQLQRSRKNSTNPTMAAVMYARY